MGDRPTIYDVAREAGVAASTVSRAYARPGRVNAETAARDLRGRRADRLPHRPDHRHARPADRRRRADGLRHHEPVLRRDHQGRRGGGPARPATRCCSPTPPRPVRSSARSWSATLDLVEGIVLASSRMSDSAIRMIAKQKPLVLLNRQITETSVHRHRQPARRAAGRRAPRRRSATTRSPTSRARRPAGPRACAGGRCGRRRTSWSCGCAASTRTTTRPCAPASPPRAGSPTSGATAVLAYNDALAIGVIKGLKQLGVRVPGDVSVVGFDNVLLAEVVDPALTTVAAPHAQGGRARRRQRAGAGRRGADRAARPLVLPVQLVVRESTAPPSAQPEQHLPGPRHDERVRVGLERRRRRPTPGPGSRGSRRGRRPRGSPVASVTCTRSRSSPVSAS